jgi:cardiolipin synthase
MAQKLLHFFNNIPPHEKRITISTALTLLRIALVPCVVMSMVWGWWGVACALFCVAAISDALDGYLARRFNEQTFLGACLDPIADKLLVLSCFFTLAWITSPVFVVPHWFFVLILVKELLLIGGSLLFYFVKGHLDVKPTMLGKITAVVQMCFIVWLFACYFFSWLPVKTYMSMLALVLVLVFASLVQYVAIGLRQI